MSKKLFIQAVFARALPKPEQREQALSYAESLWQYLSSKGYGDAGESQARDNKDYYDELNARQKRFFEGFWQAFNYKKNRNNAARRWLQLGEPTDEQYNFIIEAAKKEAAIKLPDGQARKMAEGWLFERRWTDYAPTRTAIKTAESVVLNRLVNELNQLKKLYEKSQDPELMLQIQKLETTIANAKGSK